MPDNRNQDLQQQPSESRDGRDSKTQVSDNRNQDLQQQPSESRDGCDSINKKKEKNEKQMIKLELNSKFFENKKFAKNRKLRF